MPLNLLFRALRRSSDIDGSSSQLGRDHEAPAAAGGSVVAFFAVAAGLSAALGAD